MHIQDNRHAKKAKRKSMVLEKETILEENVENTNTFTTHNNWKQIQDTDLESYYLQQPTMTLQAINDRI